MFCTITQLTDRKNGLRAVRNMKGRVVSVFQIQNRLSDAIKEVKQLQKLLESPRLGWLMRITYQLKFLFASQRVQSLTYRLHK